MRRNRLTCGGVQQSCCLRKSVNALLSSGARPSEITANPQQSTATERQTSAAAVRVCAYNLEYN